MPFAQYVQLFPSSEPTQGLRILAPLLGGTLQLLLVNKLRMEVMMVTSERGLLANGTPIQSSAFPSASMLRDDGCPSSLTIRVTLMVRGPCWLRTDSSVTQKESQWLLSYCHFEVVLLLRHRLASSDWYSLSIVLCEKELLIFVKVSSHFLSSRQLSWPLET